MSSRGRPMDGLGMSIALGKARALARNGVRHWYSPMMLMGLAAGGTVRSRPAGRAQNVQAVQRALEGAGVQFIPEIGGGAGVRLRKDFSRKNKG